jgi:hypothetical protein
MCIELIICLLILNRSYFYAVYLNWVMSLKELWIYGLTYSSHDLAKYFFFLFYFILNFHFHLDEYKEFVYILESMYILHETLFLDIRGTKKKNWRINTQNISFSLFPFLVLYSFLYVHLIMQFIASFETDLHTHRHNGFELDLLLKWRRLLTFFVFISNFYADGSWTRMLWLLIAIKLSGFIIIQVLNLSWF